MGAPGLEHFTKGTDNYETFQLRNGGVLPPAAPLDVQRLRFVSSF